MRAEATFISYSRVELECPYDADFVSALKGDIPSRNRSWNPERKVWTVFGPNRHWAEYAVDLLLEYFPDAFIEDVYATPPPPPPPPPRENLFTPDPDFAALHLLPSAPPHLVSAAYKVLAKSCHPDRGGSEEAMRTLNLAIERLRDRGAA